MASGRHPMPRSQAAARGLARRRATDCIALQLDVRDEAAFQRAFDAAVQRFGGIDVMVNNAARHADHLALGHHWRRVGRGAGGQPARQLLRLPHRGAPHARARRGPDRQPVVDRGPAGKRGDRRALRGVEGGHRRADARLRAGTGAARRHGQRALAGSDARARRWTNSSRGIAARGVVATLPVGRFGEADEVAAAAVYLASPAAAS